MPIAFVDAIFWIAVACAAVAQAAILRSVLLVRHDDAPAELRDQVPRPRRAVEIAYAVVPALALALVLWATWRTMHPPRPGAAPSTSSRISASIR